MDLSKDAIQEVVELFNIKYTDAEIENNAISEEVVREPFQDLENEVSEIISEMEDKGEAMKPNVMLREKDILTNKNVEEKELETIEDLIANSVEEASAMTRSQEDKQTESENIDSPQEEIDFDSIVVEETGIEEKDEEIISGKVIVEEDIEVIPLKDKEGNVKGEVLVSGVKDISWNTKGESTIKGGTILWNIDSPSELYDEFYKIKAEKIDTFSCGRQLDFERYHQDLVNCKVDISTEVLDSDILMKKLDEVVQCIERVSTIQIKVNHQYFVWKRFVELLRGALARVQYLKPVLKQDGLMLEHMGDVEFYVERLNDLHKSADQAMRTLEKAFDALSRKITVMLTIQGKHTDRRYPNPDGYSSPQIYNTFVPATVQNYVEENEEDVNIMKKEQFPGGDMNDYDDFKVGTTVQEVKAPIGFVGWGEI